MPDPPARSLSFSLVTIVYAVRGTWASIRHSLRVMTPRHLDIRNDVPRDSALGGLKLLWTWLVTLPGLVVLVIGHLCSRRLLLVLVDQPEYRNKRG